MKLRAPALLAALLGFALAGPTHAESAKPGTSRIAEDGTSPFAEQGTRPFAERGTRRIGERETLRIAKLDRLAVPSDVLVRIIRDEDERTITPELLSLASSGNKTAVMALGRIGQHEGVKTLTDLFQNEHDLSTKALAAFALGECEDADAAPVLLEYLKNLHEHIPNTDQELVGRACEALGKIASNKDSAKKLGDAKVKEIWQDLLSVAESETAAASAPKAIPLILTVLLRIKAPESVPSIAKHLTSTDPEIRWQAANVLARMKVDITAALVSLRPLLHDESPLVRAYAARALGATKDKDSTEALCTMLKDKDPHPVIFAIQALGSTGDSRATEPLLALGNELLNQLKSTDTKTSGIPTTQNQLLLIATALGEIKDEKALPFLKELRAVCEKTRANPEIEIAVAKFGEKAFFDLSTIDNNTGKTWQTISARAQGLGELKGDRAKSQLLEMLASKPDPRAVSEILNALAAVKSENLQEILLENLKAEDVIVRSTAAGLLADAGDSSPKVISALEQALEAARRDKMNDCRIAIIEAADKLKHPLNTQVLSGPTRDHDYIVRRRAIELMRDAGESTGDLSASPMETGHDQSYWQRMAALVSSKENPKAIIHTKKGPITLELFAKDSPMMVDNFIQLSKSGYYNGLTFMRVVPNFVIQGGDPRNDMNGGPGYQVRDEINLHPYLSGTVGIALSGKDTGGSQFFLTNLPQPHLDGGYTVIGQATMNSQNVIDDIARGDTIDRIEIFTAP